MSKSQTQTIDKEGGKKRVVAIVVLVVVVAILVGVIIYLVVPKQEKKRTVLINEDNVEEFLDTKPEETSSEADHYTVMMNTYWTFSDGDAVSDNAYVGNYKDNTHDVFFDIFLTNKDGSLGDLIMESPVIPVGMSMDKIKLDKRLENGIYDCVMTYHLVDDKQGTLSTVDVKLTINIGNINQLEQANE